MEGRGKGVIKEFIRRREENITAVKLGEVERLL